MQIFEISDILALIEIQSLIPQSVCQARLDSDLTHLVLHVPHAQHPVALRHRASERSFIDI